VLFEVRTFLTSGAAAVFEKEYEQLLSGEYTVEEFFDADGK
jgi:hypothetical protein